MNCDGLRNRCLAWRRDPRTVAIIVEVALVIGTNLVGESDEKLEVEPLPVCTYEQRKPLVVKIGNLQSADQDRGEVDYCGTALLEV